MRVSGTWRRSTSKVGSSSPFMPCGAWSTNSASGWNRRAMSAMIAALARLTMPKLTCPSRDAYSSGATLTTDGRRTSERPRGRGNLAATGEPLTRTICSCSVVRSRWLAIARLRRRWPNP